jgi:predicted type IV restriction endonuclease
MAKVPAKVAERLIKTIPAYKKVLADAQGRDVNESDTVTIITDILSDVFGFDKYGEITREFVIQGTYCDLAIKIDEQVYYLIEVKAIGIDLKENHIRQAINYAAKSGIKWVVLTNGITWIIYRVLVDGKVASEEVCSFEFLELNPKKEEDQEAVFMLCRRGLDKDLIEQFYEYRQSVNKYMLSAVLKSEPVLNSIRRELKKIKDGLRVELDEIENILWNEVIKREVAENEATIESISIVKRINRRIARKAEKDQKLEKEADEPSDLEESTNSAQSHV